MSATKEHNHDKIAAGQQQATRSEKPILFSAPMVQAILAGRKTQTRRILKPIPRLSESVDNCAKYLNEYSDFKDRYCPYGKPGDLLWVRETHAPTSPEYLHKESKLPCIYKASIEKKYSAETKKIMNDMGWKWKPSIHMKKEYARIWLEVEEIKVNRLQDISSEDAVAEGILPLAMSAMQLADSEQLYFDYTQPKQLFNEGLPPFWSFNSLWCSINGGDSWETNPWVWKVKFKELSRTGKPHNCYKSNELCKYDCKGLCKESM